MNFFLAKTDPETYSIDQFEQDKQTVWDGVHNFQAIACIRSWKIGDIVYIYHSQSDKSIVGIGQVSGLPFQNTNDTRPSWACNLKFLKKIDKSNQVTLKQIKDSGLFPNFLLVKNPRLSTMSCPLEFVTWLESRI